jgi:F0F1-type ATP synthase assembly protein I
MKPLPKQPRTRTGDAPTTEDSLGLGIEAAVVVALFFGVGWLVDRLAGTTPLFMIIMTVLAAIGLFAKFKYRYDARMDEHEAQRRAGAESTKRTAA